MIAVGGLLLIGAVVVGAVFAGWSTGLATARAQATGTAMAEAQLQCALIPADLAAGHLTLAQRRLSALQSAAPAPACLALYAPTATLLHQQAQASPTATATATMTATLSPTATAQPTSQPATATATATSGVEYDLAALLAEAQADYERRDFPAAIDTLGAIISLDADFQRNLVQRLILESLMAQAQLLYRTGKLSEANVLTDRARAFGDVGSLNYEYFIADTYLNGQRTKTTNPSEAVRLLRRIVYEQGLANYMNGRALGELQDALRYYADALALQGDACQARAQYQAALDLHPSVTYVNRGLLTGKRQEAELACNEALQIAGTPLAIGPAATPAAVGQR